MMFCSPPYPALPLHLPYHFAWSESFTLRSLSAFRCQTLSRSWPRVAVLVPLVGKVSVTKIMVSSRSRRGSNSGCFGPLSIVASMIAILTPPPSWFRPLAPYCPFSRPLTAKTAPRLAPYGSQFAGTLLLQTGWHPTAPLRWLASPLPGGSARLRPSYNRLTVSRLCPGVVLHCLRAYWPTRSIDIMACATT